MATPSSSYDIVILGSGIAGLAGALAAHELGLQSVVLEKAAALGGGTVHSYGLIWVGQNYLARDAGISDSHDEVLAYMRFLGGGAVDEARLAAFVARSPEVLKFFADCGIRFRLVRGITDHYYDKAPGSHAAGPWVRLIIRAITVIAPSRTASRGPTRDYGRGRRQTAVRTLPDRPCSVTTRVGSDPTPR